jgi:hypothetical protein
VVNGDAYGVSEAAGYRQSRQSYAKVIKRATIMVGRCGHVHQLKRTRRALSML